MVCAPMVFYRVHLAHKMNCNTNMKMSIFTKSICTAVIASASFITVGAQETKLTVNVETAGSLSTLLTSEQISNVTTLTVTGKLNSTDIKLIRRMAGLDENGDYVSGNNLQNIDMSGADIVAGGEPYYYTATTQDNVLGDYMFYNANQLKTIKIPTSTVSIGYLAVGDCNGITEFDIPDNVTYINQAAFEVCSSLENVKFGKGLKTIDGYAFKSCEALKEAILPEGLESLNDYAFYGCSSMTKAFIPSTVKTIGWFTFSGNSSLTDLTISDGVQTITENAFSGCSSLQKLVIPNSVNSIEASAFDGCESLTDVTLSKNITEISDGMFSSCTNLQTLDIPEGVVRIGEEAFCYDENLKSLSIPNSLTEIGDNAFFSCENLKEITLGADFEALGADAFKFCDSLEKINISDENELYSSIDGVLYDKDKSTLLFLPPANTEEYTVPTSVTELAENCAITNSKLRKLVISDNVVTVGDGAFKNCENLENVTIGNGVTEFGDDVFFMDANIKEIYCRLTEPLEIDKYTFWRIDYDACTLYVPKGCTTVYSEANIWKNFKTIKEEGTTNITLEKHSDNVLTVNGKIIPGYNGGKVVVFDMLGNLVLQTNDSDIALPQSGTYVVRFADKAIKISL